MLTPGTHLNLPRHGGRWQVGALLGEGGQGAVYELHSEDRPGATLAVKWYRPEAAHPAQRAALGRLARIATPSDAFIWPLEVIDDDGGFGYAMALRPDHYLPIADLLNGQIDASFTTVARLCVALADGFLQLHAQGLCYRDISLGNIFFDPVTGHPLICDNDNVGVEGKDPARVLGTARFMAPEIVRGEALPSIATDLYSLSVLLFYLLMVHHPLEGRRELEFACYDREAERALFGADPMFVFDPTDDSNRPDPAVHGAVLQYWPLYPAYLREDFLQAFTAGLRTPALRVRDSVWRSHLARLLDGITLCPCGRENPTDDGIPFRPCWSCGNLIEPPPRLRFAGGVVVLNAGTRVTRHHVARDFVNDVVLAEVTEHPRRPGAWGLTNRGDRPWSARTPDGDDQEILPGRSIGLIAGTVIDFRSGSATLEAGPRD